MKEFGHPRRGWLGVRIQQVTPDIADSLGLKDASGAMVAGVTDGGPADKAKIRSGDIILKFDGQDVKDMHALPRIVAETDVGKEVPVVLWRDGKEVTVQADAGRKAGRRAAGLGRHRRQAGADATKPTEICRAWHEGGADDAGSEGQVPDRRRPEGRGDHRRDAERRRRRNAG